MRVIKQLFGLLLLAGFAWGGVLLLDQGLEGSLFPSVSEVGDSAAETSLDESELLARVEALDEALAGALSALQVRPSAIVVDEPEDRRRDGLRWTYSHLAIQLPQGVTPAQLRDEVRRGAESIADVQVYTSTVDEITVHFRAYVGSFPTHFALVRPWLDPAPMVSEGQEALVAVVVHGVDDDDPSSARILRMPEPMTVGIPPFRPHTLRLAEVAARQSKEVVVALQGPEATLPAPVAEQLQAVPFVSGALDLLGGVLRSDGLSAASLRALGSRGLFLIDVASEPLGAGKRRAREEEVPLLARPVAIREPGNEAASARAVTAALNLALRSGGAVIVVAASEESVDFLDALFTRGRDAGFRFVFASELVQPGSGSAR